MTKERNIIQEVLGLIQQLEQERHQYQQKIDDIDSALAQIRGGSAGASASAALGKRRGRPPGAKAAAGLAPASAVTASKGGRGGNEMSLRERMAQATNEKPLSVREIVEAVKRAGHKFQSADPIKSVGSYLYGPEGKKHFKRLDGKFSPLGGSTVGNGRRAKPVKAKRTMSAEARKRIGEAVKARWAKQKAAAKK